MAFEVVTEVDPAGWFQLEQLQRAGNTVMLLGQGERVLGLLAVADTIRPEGLEVVDRWQWRRSES